MVDADAEVHGHSCKSCSGRGEIKVMGVLSCVPRSGVSPGKESWALFFSALVGDLGKMIQGLAA